MMREGLNCRACHIRSLNCTRCQEGMCKVRICMEIIRGEGIRFMGCMGLLEESFRDSWLKENCIFRVLYIRVFHTVFLHSNSLGFILPLSPHSSSPAQRLPKSNIIPPQRNIIVLTQPVPLKRPHANINFPCSFGARRADESLLYNASSLSTQ